MGIGGPGTGARASVDRAQSTNDYAGKILRMRDDGSVPLDNPFVGKSGYKPLHLLASAIACRSVWRSIRHTTGSSGSRKTGRTAATS